MGGTRGRGGMLVWAVSAMLSAAAACGGAHDHPDGPKAPGKGGAPGNAGGGGAAGAAGAGGSPAGAGGSSGGGGMCQAPAGGACAVPGCGVGLLPDGSDLTDVWIGPAGEVWATAEGGFVGRRAPDTGAWCWCAPFPPHTLRAIWGASSTSLFAVGDTGTVLQFDGTRWLRHLVVNLDLNAVHGTSGNDVWAAGERGSVVHFDGNTWQAETAGSQYQLNAVWIDPTGVVRVGGSAPLPQPDPYQPSDTEEAIVLRNDPPGSLEWPVELSVPQRGSSRIASLAGNSATDIWAAGVNTPSGAAAGYGGMYHFDGTVWTAPPFVDEILQSHFFSDLATGTPDAGATWFVGGVSGVRYDGTTFTQAPELASATRIDARGEEMYAVGEDGIVLRWTAHTGWTITRPATAPAAITVF